MDSELTTQLSELGSSVRLPAVPQGIGWEKQYGEEYKVFLASCVVSRLKLKG